MDKTPTSFLQLKHIAKKYEDRAVLSDINFELNEHEIICLLGASGSGKTTTLQIIAGLERSDKGEVWVEGQMLSSDTQFVPPEKRRIGFVFQDKALFPHLTVGRNVNFGIRGLMRPQRQARALAELKRLGMESYIDFYPHQLSGGESQKVALARALATDPKILLLDEPFASLDKQWRESLREEIVELLRERGCSCVFVTHDPEEACYIADSIVLIDKGKIEQQGTPDGLYHKPTSLRAAQFFGKLNTFEAEVVQGAVRVGEDFILPLVEKEAEMEGAERPHFSEGQKVLVAFRPEALSPRPPAATAAAAANTIMLEVQPLQRRFLGKMTEWTLLWRGASVGERKLTAQTSGSTSDSTGAQDNKFYLDPKAVHLFRV